jgi:ABC-type bacteriocin/lantibiotic exporter with double-glycine peptidase domain
VALDWGTTAHLVDAAASQRQRHRNDCGPASLRRIRAAGLCRGPLPPIDTVRRGCTLADLERAATASGACGRIVRFTALQQLSLPAILHLRRRHFVVLETLQPDVARLFDPGHGLLLMRPHDVVPHLTGAALEFVTPTVAARPGGS